MYMNCLCDAAADGVVLMKSKIWFLFIEIKWENNYFVYVFF